MQAYLSGNVCDIFVFSNNNDFFFVSQYQKMTKLIPPKFWKDQIPIIRHKDILRKCLELMSHQNNQNSLLSSTTTKDDLKKMKKMKIIFFPPPQQLILIIYQKI